MSPLENRCKAQRTTDEQAFNPQRSNLYSLLRLSRIRRTLLLHAEEPTINALTVTQRVYGAATAGYGAYSLIAPEHLSRQLGLDNETATRLGRAFGVRDLTIGLSLLVTSNAQTRQRLLGSRVAIDMADAVGIGVLSPKPEGRKRGAAVAGFWGAIALALLVAQRRATNAR